jgi:hypothetical protein
MKEYVLFSGEGAPLSAVPVIPRGFGAYTVGEDAVAPVRHLRG